MAPYLVGITGGIGSGKSTLSSIFYHLGYKIYNSDDRAKHLMNFNEKIKKDLIDSFGERVYDKNGLNKKYLSKTIFNDTEALRKINSIVHPEVINDFKVWVKENQNEKILFKEAAILFENGTAQSCDAIILITAPEEVRIQRVLKRDETSVAAIKDRINKQWPDAKKIPLADFLIENIDLEESKKQARKIHLQLLGDRVNT